MQYCFDVFDTVVTRIFAQPEELFLKVGRTMIEHHLYSKSEEEWMRVRQDAQQKLANQIGAEKLTLRGIYTIIQGNLSWSPGEMKQAQNLEISVEIDSIWPVPRIKNIIQKLHLQQENIIFFSDMYLDSDTMQSLLEKCGLWKTGDIIYVSSTHGENKASGTLFERYIQDSNKNPKELIYYGNTLAFDIEPAKKVGMNTVLVPDCDLTRYEQAILSTNQHDKRLISLITGISRISRIQHIDISPQEQTLINISANVIAPTVFFFTFWCLQEAKRLNIERLYFISRDGAILYQIALRICKAYGITMDCRYLYGSRHAWNTKAHTQEENKYTIGYLLQEGFADGISSAIIDIGWAGTMQKYLHSILEESGYYMNNNITGLYLALFPEGVARNNNQYIPYFAPNIPPKKRDFLFKDMGNRAVLELFLQANHGTVCSYSYAHGIYNPTFFPKEPELVSAQGCDLIQKTILYYCDQLLSECNEIELSSINSKSIVENILSLFILKPTKEESNTIGAQLFSQEQDNSTYQELAPAQKPSYPNQIFWKQGSISRKEVSTQDAKKIYLLNIGCGDRYHDAFVNIDLHPISKDILRYDATKRLPFPDRTFDLVYHSHLLEHMARKNGALFITECRRILKPGGILRLAVPDLKRLAESYLNALQEAQKGGLVSSLKHEWSIIELYDQAVRTYSGGEANTFIAQTTDKEMKQFLIQRWGNMAMMILYKKYPPQKLTYNKSSWWHLREVLLRILLGSEYKFLKTSRYQHSGETHKWMYDSHALGSLLSKSGFDHIVERNPFESYSSSWESYHLDTEQDGTVVKPDSIYVEGIAV